MRLGLIVLVVAAAACTNEPADDTETFDCTKVTNADTFVVGLEKMGTSGNLDFRLMEADPAPPIRGDNSWVLQLNTMNSGVVGTPVMGATLVVTPFMPAHSHGTPIKVEVTEMPQAGQYTLAPVNLWMPGVWEITINATQGSTNDAALYRFCIPN